MYIRYVNKLHELHRVANNHAEAGLTLQLYAKVLNWQETMLPKEMQYEAQRECDRKEMLYTQIINCFDNGKVKNGLVNRITIVKHARLFTIFL